MLERFHIPIQPLSWYILFRKSPVDEGSCQTKQLIPGSDTALLQVAQVGLTSTKNHQTGVA